MTGLIPVATAAAASLALALLLHISSGSAKSLDMPVLVCPYMLPAPADWPAMWEELFQPDRYRTLLQLCSGQSPLPNTGCQCIDHEVVCDYIYPSLTAYCSSRCRCLDHDVQETEQRPTALAAAALPATSATPGLGYYLDDSALGDPQSDHSDHGGTVHNGLSRNCSANAEPGQGTCSVSDTPSEPASSGVSTPSRCLGTCNTVAVGCHANCKCTAFRSSRPTPRLLGRCGRRPGDKRRRALRRENNTDDADDENYEIPYGCPCNTTYVSNACCDSVDGIIYEPTSMKLGELSPDD